MAFDLFLPQVALHSLSEKFEGIVNLTKNKRVIIPAPEPIRLGPFHFR